MKIRLTNGISFFPPIFSAKCGEGAESRQGNLAQRHGGTERQSSGEWGFESFSVPLCPCARILSRCGFAAFRAGERLRISLATRIRRSPVLRPANVSRRCGGLSQGGTRTVAAGLGSTLARVCDDRPLLTWLPKVPSLPLDWPSRPPAFSLTLAGQLPETNHQPVFRPTAGARVWEPTSPSSRTRIFKPRF